MEDNSYYHLLRSAYSYSNNSNYISGVDSIGYVSSDCTCCDTGVSISFKI